MGCPGRDAGLHSSFADIGDRKKAQKKERPVTGISGDMLLAGRHQQCIAGVEQVFAAIGKGRAFARQNINAFFMVEVLMGGSWGFTGLWHGNLCETQSDTDRAFFTGDNFEGFAARKSKLLRFGLPEDARH